MQNQPYSPALLPAAGLCLGIALAELLQPNNTTAGIICMCTTLLLCTGLIAGRRMSARVYKILVVLAFLGFGCLRLAITLPKNNPEHYLHLEPKNSRIEVTLLDLLNPSGNSIRWRTAVTAVSEKSVTGNLLLQIPDSLATEQWQSGDRVLIFGRITPPQSPKNPFDFDYARYLKNQNIYGLVYLKPGTYRYFPERSPNLWQRLKRLRVKLINALENSGLLPAEAGLAQALLLGYRGLEPEQYKSFQKAGAAHVLAVSGLHVGIFSTLLGWLLWPLRRLTYGKIIHGFMLLLLLWGYVLLAGAGPAIVRAAVLFSLLTYAVLSNKSGQSMHFWAIALLILLGLIEPRWLFNAGFQMSFAAVWSILVYYPKLFRRWPFKKGIAGYFGQLNCLGISAQIGVLPISLYYFHQFPLHFLLSNLLLVPALGIVLGWGYLILLTSSLNLTPKVLITGYDYVLRALNYTADGLSQMDMFLLTRITWGPVPLVVSLIAILFFTNWIRISRYKGMVLGLGCLLILAGYRVWRTANTTQTQVWIIPHRVGESSLWIHNGYDLTVYAQNKEPLVGLTERYAAEQGVSSVRYGPLKNSYTLIGTTLLRIDASGCYPKEGYSPEVLVLTESPPIHLGRAIKALQPRLIIADGSNYHSDLNRWERTCLEYGIPFHSTFKKGAFQQTIATTP